VMPRTRKKEKRVKGKGVSGRRAAHVVGDDSAEGGDVFHLASVVAGVARAEALALILKVKETETKWRMRRARLGKRVVGKESPVDAGVAVVVVHAVVTPAGSSVVGVAEVARTAAVTQRTKRVALGLRKIASRVRRGARGAKAAETTSPLPRHRTGQRPHSIPNQPSIKRDKSNNNEFKIFLLLQHKIRLYLYYPKIRIYGNILNSLLFYHLHHQKQLSEKIIFQKPAETSF